MKAVVLPRQNEQKQAIKTGNTTEFDLLLVRSTYTPLRGYSVVAVLGAASLQVSSHTPLRGYSAFLHKKVMGFLCRMQNFSPLFCTSRVVSCKREVNIENYLAISCANLPGFCGRLGFAQWGQSIITPSCSRRNWRPRDSIRGFQLLPKR